MIQFQEFLCCCCSILTDYIHLINILNHSQFSHNLKYFCDSNSTHNFNSAWRHSSQRVFHCFYFDLFAIYERFQVDRASHRKEDRTRNQENVLLIKIDQWLRNRKRRWESFMWKNIQKSSKNGMQCIHDHELAYHSRKLIHRNCVTHRNCYFCTSRKYFCIEFLREKQRKKVFLKIVYFYHRQIQLKCEMASTKSRGFGASTKRYSAELFFLYSSSFSYFSWLSKICEAFYNWFIISHSFLLLSLNPLLSAFIRIFTIFFHSFSRFVVDVKKPDMEK